LFRNAKVLLRRGRRSGLDMLVISTAIRQIQ
jgi:hypothetical protein